MKTNHLRLVLCLIVTSLLTACASTPPASPVSYRYRSDKPTSDLRNELIYVTVKDNPKLSETVNNYLIKNGFKVAPNPSEAHLSIMIEGAFSLRYQGRSATWKLGDQEIKPLDAVAQGDSKQGGGLATRAVAAAIMEKGMPFKPLTATSIADFVADQTGIRSSVNTFLTGRPDGACIAGLCNYALLSGGIYVTSNKYNWAIQHSGYYLADEVDDRIAMLIEASISPLYGEEHQIPPSRDTQQKNNEQMGAKHD